MSRLEDEDLKSVRCSAWIGWYRLVSYGHMERQPKKEGQHSDLARPFDGMGIGLVRASGYVGVFSSKVICPHTCTDLWG